MVKAVDVVLVVILLAVSLTGVVASAWSLSVFSAPALPNGLRSHPVVLCLIALAIVVEGVRFFIARHGKAMWRTSPVDCVTIALPIWMLCTMYCIALPFLALLLVPIPVLTSSVLGGLSLSWIFLQLAVGVMPVALQPASPRPEMAALVADDPRTATGQPKSLPRTRGPAAQKPCLKRATVPKAVSSADDMFQVLSKFARLPEGTMLSEHGHVGAGGELTISQQELAKLTHRSRSTVNRWLQELEERNRITKLASGNRPTRIRMLPQHPVQAIFATMPRASQSSSPQ